MAPPKKQLRKAEDEDVSDRNSTVTRASQRTRSSKGPLLPVIDPDALLDGRKDPSRTTQRREAAAKAQATKRKRAEESLVASGTATIPGSFPADDVLDEDTTPIQTLPTLENPSLPQFAFDPVPEVRPYDPVAESTSVEPQYMEVYENP